MAAGSLQSLPSPFFCQLLPKQRGEAQRGATLRGRLGAGGMPSPLSSPAGVGGGGGEGEEAGLPHLPLWHHSSLNCFLFVSCGSGKMQLFFLAKPFCIFPLPVLSLPSTALMLSLST